MRLLKKYRVRKSMSELIKNSEIDYGLLLAIRRLNTGVLFYDVALDVGQYRNGRGYVDMVLTFNGLWNVLFHAVVSVISLSTLPAIRRGSS